MHCTRAGTLRKPLSYRIFFFFLMNPAPYIQDNRIAAKKNKQTNKQNKKQTNIHTKKQTNKKLVLPFQNDGQNTKFHFAA